MGILSSCFFLRMMLKVLLLMPLKLLLVWKLTSILLAVLLVALQHPVHPCCLVAEELIRPGDYILTINGVSIEGWSCDRVSSALGAKEYPFLVLTLRRFLHPHSIPPVAVIFPTVKEVKPWGYSPAVFF